MSKAGLGDKVEKITKATGIKAVVDAFTPEGKDCGCESRKQKLNNVTLQRREPSGCLTQELYERWGDFKERNPKAINHDDQQLICDIVREVWAMSFAPCGSCSSKVWQSRIDKINTVHASYEEKSKKPVNRGKSTRGRKRPQKKDIDSGDKKPDQSTSVRTANGASDTSKPGGGTDTVK